jgi:hypothetical protein
MRDYRFRWLKVDTPMTRKKSRKKPSKRQRKGRPERGFDFGVSRRAVLASGAEVVSELFTATVQGCGYGLVRHEDLGNIPEIALAAVNGDPLKRALIALNAWDAAEGDDGFDLQFVFLNDGGYLLGIAPNASIIRNKMRGSDRLFEPIVTGPMFIKGMTSRQPFLSTFRTYIETNTIAPFMFSGLQWTSPLTAPQTVAGMPQILKFAARFTDEDAVTEGSFAEAMVAVSRGTVRTLIRKGRRLMRSPPGDSSEVPRRREAQIQRHFPATFWRLSGASAVADFRARYASLPISESQVIQAYVNLLLSNEIVGNFHYKGIGRAHLSQIIHLKVSDRFELADSSPVPAFSDELVLKQIVLDGISLLQELGLKAKSSVPEQVLKLLDRNGLV